MKIQILVSILFVVSMTSASASQGGPSSCPLHFMDRTGIDLYQIKGAQVARYEYDIKGLHLSFELIPHQGTKHDRVDLQNFKLNFDPSKMFPGSFFRRVLGRKPMDYTHADLRYFSQNSVNMGLGPVVEFYVRLPSDPAKAIDEGALIMISLDTGKIAAYPAGTNVDSFAVLDFVRGLSIEAHNAISRPRGQWYIAEPNGAGDMQLTIPQQQGNLPQ